MNDDFGVRSRFEDMALLDQTVVEIAKIVDLSVENHPHTLILIRYRLMSTIEVDNGKSPMAQTKRSRRVEPLVVGPTMDESVGHGLEETSRDRLLGFEVINTGVAAHINQRLCS
jgi:hypothetical protein